MTKARRVHIPRHVQRAIDVQNQLERPWTPYPTNLPASVKRYVTLLVRIYEERREPLDVHDMATLVAKRAFDTGQKVAEM